MKDNAGVAIRYQPVQELFRPRALQDQEMPDQMRKLRYWRDLHGLINIDLCGAIVDTK